MSRDLDDDNYYISNGGKIPIKWTAPEVSSTFDAANEMLNEICTTGNETNETGNEISETGNEISEIGNEISGIKHETWGIGIRLMVTRIRQ